MRANNNLRVHLFNLRGDEYCRGARAAKDNLGLITNRIALAEQGFHAVSLVPNRPIESASVADIWQDVLPQLERSVLSDRLNVFAFSVNTHDYYKLPPFIARLKEKFPGSLFVAGGPHFVREGLVDVNGRHYRDTVQVGLNDGLDAVFTGHCQSFVEFICDFLANLEEATVRGLYHAGNVDELKPVKLGRYPQLQTVPRLKFNEGYGLMETITENACPHGCGICAANPGGLGFTRDVLKRSLMEMIGEVWPGGHVGFYNLNAFVGKNPLLLEVLEEVEAPGDFATTKNASFDPSLLLDPGALATIRRAINIGFNEFFLGVETASARVAELIGIKDKHGKVKDKDQLEAEQKAIKNFIRLLRSQLGGIVSYYKITLSYVMTPFETHASIQRMFDQIGKYLALADDGLVVEAHLIPLAPFPGTQVRRDFLHLVEDPEQFHFYRHDYYWGWKGSLGQQLDLLDQLVLRGVDRFRIGNFRQALDTNAKLAQETFSGQHQLSSVKERQELFKELAV